MLRFFFNRPIGVLMSLVTLLVLSIAAYVHLPSSLLPDIDVPEITVIVHQTEASPEEIENTILAKLRESLLSVHGVDRIESIAQNETGRLLVQFDREQDMSLAYIAVSEKVDRFMPLLPAGVPRPNVVESNLLDIPIAKIQITSTDQDAYTLSELSSKVLKRRIEQLDGVGAVDLNGLQKKVLAIALKQDVIRALGLTPQDVVKTIQESDLDMGSIAVVDGQYQFPLILNTKLKHPTELNDLPIALPGNRGFVGLHQIASIIEDTETPKGFHVINNKEGVVINIYQQPGTQLEKVMPKLYQLVAQFQTDYTSYQFTITQDQSVLLNFSIDNLNQSILFGSLFSVLILFIFVKGWREPLIMSVILPIALLLTFLIFYAFHITLNIISLSGLILGMGMLVDNSIVVIDSISLRRNKGESLLDSCVVGTKEVLAPLCSSALTNLAVFIPLVFISGVAGSLFKQQAISVAIVLSIALVCSFMVVPVIYLLLKRNDSVTTQKDTFVYRKIQHIYSRSFDFAWRHSTKTLIIISLMIPLGAICYFLLDKELFPNIDRTETILTLNWNEPIDAVENKRRIEGFLSTSPFNTVPTSEAEIGLQQFLFNKYSQSAQTATLYFAFGNSQEKATVDKLISQYFTLHFPQASVQLSPGENAFEKMFPSHGHQLEARFRSADEQIPMDFHTKDTLALQVSKINGSKLGASFSTETILMLNIDRDRLNAFDVSYTDFVSALRLGLADYTITELKDFGNVIPIKLGGEKKEIDQALNEMEIRFPNGIRYPVRTFVGIDYSVDYKTITADEHGSYQFFTHESIRNVDSLEVAYTTLANAFGFKVDFHGSYYETEKHTRDFGWILLIAVLLMYFIMTVEFESFSMPLLVMVTIPIGLSGSLLTLWLTGNSLNIMSGIGLAVVLGVLDNDAILKIDRINALRKQMPLQQAVKQAGIDRLKPIVLNTGTNILALLPILFSSGLGNDLQTPVALTTIGGLTIGTLTALYFVPLLYWKVWGRQTS